MRLGESSIEPIDTISSENWIDFALWNWRISRGRVNEIYGQSGKTTLSIHAISETQNRRIATATCQNIKFDLNCKKTWNRC